MFHRLVRFPPIQLSFNLAIVLPRRSIYVLTYTFVNTNNIILIVYSKTKRVSNPRRYSYSHASASVKIDRLLSSLGETYKLGAFHRWFISFINLILTKEKSFKNSPVNHYSGIWLFFPPTHPIRPIITDNARHSCITAAAGTCIGHGFFLNLIIILIHGQTLQLP